MTVLHILTPPFPLPHYHALLFAVLFYVNFLQLLYYLSAAFNVFLGITALVVQSECLHKFG